MPLQKYLCMADSQYEDAESWDSWGVEVMADRPVSAAWIFVEKYPEEAGVEFDLIESESTEVFSILVKDTATNEIVRCAVTGKLSFRVTNATLVECPHESV